MSYNRSYLRTGMRIGIDLLNQLQDHMWPAKWKPTIFAYSSIPSYCFSIIYGKKGVDYWSFSLLWWITLELQHKTIGVAIISVCVATIGQINFRYLNNRPAYLGTEKRCKDGISISIGLTWNKVCFIKEIMIKHFISRAGRLNRLWD